MNNSILYLDNPAYEWLNATPVGNGSSGMMVFGGVASDKLTLNEESIWSSLPTEDKQLGMKEKIKKIREMLISGKVHEANEWISENVNDYVRIKSYEYAGKLTFAIHEDDECEDYRRELDLAAGVCRVSYKKDGAAYKREYFASMKNGVIAVRFSADREFSLKISYERENVISRTVSDCEIRTVCRTAFGEHKFATNIRIITDGASRALCDEVSVDGAKEVVALLAIATEYKHENYVSAAEKMLDLTTDFDTMLSESAEEFMSFMMRSEVNFDFDGELSSMPVSRRIDRLKNDSSSEDASLFALYWNFGKYLIVASGAPRATLPANLQGLWVEGLVSPWNSDYHTNINLQMNYWHVEEAGLGDLTDPLFRYMNGILLPGGKEAARRIYGTRGAVVHHLSDIYGYALISDGPWGMWPLGAAWLAYHMWEHYLYTNDEKFLREVAYEYIKENALFWIDNLLPGEDGFLHTGPSMSPENAYFVSGNDGKRAYITVSPTMDIEVVGGLLDFYSEMEDTLGIDPESAREARAARAKLPPLRVGKYGQLMEWLEDYEEVEPGHRHISHAFAMYPAAEITRGTPELYRAMRVTLDRRLSHGGGHTGWSRAWIVNLFARLRDSARAYDNIRSLVAHSTAPNMLDCHPLGDGICFQIDGNFGGAAAIGEMLMQSHEGVISILPAIPRELSSGSFKGLRARGGFTVSCEWEGGVVKRLTVSADTPRSAKLEFNGTDVEKMIDGTTVIV